MYSKATNAILYGLDNEKPVVIYRTGEAIYNFYKDKSVLKLVFGEKNGEVEEIFKISFSTAYNLIQFNSDCLKDQLKILDKL